MNNKLVEDLFFEKKITVNKNERLTLAGGYSGLLVALKNLSYTINTEMYNSIKKKYIEQIILCINNSSHISTSLFGGLPGINVGLLSINDSVNSLGEYIKTIDELIIETIEKELNDYKWIHKSKGLTYGTYDLLSGLSGIALYLSKTYQLRERKVTEQVLLDILDIFSEYCKPTDNKRPYLYLTKNNLIGNMKTFFPNGGIVLGIAHGISGILLAFAEFKNLFRLTGKQKETIEYLIGILLTSINNENLFPQIISDDLANQDCKNGSWCYGNIGVTLVLSYFPEFLPSKINIENISLDFLELAMSTTTINKDSKILCHGTSGLLYYSLYSYKKTNNIKFYNAANYFYNEISVYTLEEFTDTPLDIDKGPQLKIGLLDGVAGSLLALNSFETNRRFQNDWVLGYL
ncbi:lanthionine synthetase LanC family protein [Vagococcus acidifermentans]|uniref:Lantibiotic biosynthesis protein n=1 Tax=Vagococcus acidifermentans TaxID=564710 RepID=A0A430AMA5_9ENTE|nr:lanthionine synthetase LanC family protein [Vagococcus acidifermentans]RSU09248.1 hypothetical protein CBF27_13205 [Vagococcus acidifermentans]